MHGSLGKVNRKIAGFGGKISYRLFSGLVFWSVISTLLTMVLFTESYLIWLSRTTSRMLNVRLVEEESRLPVIKRYLDFMLWGVDSCLVLIGDSQFYGHNLPDELSFGRILAEKYENSPVKIINLSIVDGRPVDCASVLELLEKKTVVGIVYELNLAHFGVNLPPDFGRLKQSSRLQLLFFPSAYHLAKSTFMARRKYFKDPMSLNIEFQHYSYGENVYMLDTKNDHNLNHLLSKMKQLTENRLVVASPHCASAFKYNSYDLELYRRDLDRYLGIVNSAGIETLDLSFEFDQNCFMDIIHLNPRGQKKMAAILDSEFISPLLCGQ